MAIYTEIDSNGTELTSIPGVLVPKALTGASLTSGSNLMTVASTSGVFAGMAVSGPGLPEGCFVHCVRSLTVLELFASAWNATTGVFTTSAANANATVTIDSGTSPAADLAYAYGFDPRVRVVKWYAMGTWRNEFSIPASVSPGGAVSYGNAGQASSIDFPGLLTGLAAPFGAASSASSASLTPTATIFSDTCAATPLKRHNGEPWDFFIFVSTGGIQSFVPANPQHRIVYAGAD